MRHLPIVFAAVLAVSPALADEPPPNPAIDMKAHIRLTEEAAIGFSSYPSTLSWSTWPRSPRL